MISKILETIKSDLTLAMKTEVSLKKEDNYDNEVMLFCITQKEVSRAIISMFPEIGTKPDKATDEDTIKLLKKFISSEKERELYQQRFIGESDVSGLGSMELKQLVNSKLQELGDTLTSKRIEIAKNYLPKQATEEEIVLWIKDNIDFSLLKNKMQAMGLIMKQFSGCDGHMVRNILSKF